MRQPPDGLQAGALKPPLPLGMPAGRTAPAEINRLTVSLQQVGHLGSGSLAERCKYSNSHSQDSQKYSKIGIARYSLAMALGAPGRFYGGSIDGVGALPHRLGLF
jgi:hypothetical protein